LRFLLQGERGLVVEFADYINPQIFAKVRRLQRWLQENPPAGLVETVTTYRSLLLVYDPLQNTPAALQNHVLQIDHDEPASLEQGRVIPIPVCYGGEYGPDLAELCSLVGLSPEEVIAEHTSRDYLVYMLGFTPGFPYLGGLSPRIACPRLSSPRTLVPAGSVGIAEQQTGIYPLDSPGGWRLIGKTPLKIFDPHRQEPFLAQAGDSLHFYPIDVEEFVHLHNQHIHNQPAGR